MAIIGRKNFDQMSVLWEALSSRLLFISAEFSFAGINSILFGKRISQFNPLLYFINGIRYGVLGVADVALWECVVISCLSLIVFFGFCQSQFEAISHFKMVGSYV